MRLLIVGTGRVGFRTARSVRDSGHDVAIVEVDPEAARQARDEGFETVEGDGALETTLQQTDLESVDGIAALTSDLNANLAACTIADQYDCRTVMRIDEDYREGIYREHVDVVDEVVHPERLGAILAKNALVGGNSRAIADVELNLQIVEFTITEDAPMQGYTLRELELPGPARLIAFGPQGEPLDLPQADQMLSPGDRLVVLADSGRLDDLRRIVVGDGGPRARGDA
jgi:K+ transport systems, NAD-binding component